MAWNKTPLNPQPATNQNSQTLDQLLEDKIALDERIYQMGVDDAQRQRKKLEALAQALGISVKQLMGFHEPSKEPEKKERKKRETKLYRNPDNPEETYRGFGKRPAWLQTRLDAGNALENFLVQS